MPALLGGRGHGGLRLPPASLPSRAYSARSCRMHSTVMLGLTRRPSAILPRNARARPVSSSATHEGSAWANAPEASVTACEQAQPEQPCLETFVGVPVFGGSMLPERPVLARTLMVDSPATALAALSVSVCVATGMGLLLLSHMLGPLLPRWFKQEHQPEDHEAWELPPPTSTPPSDGPAAVRVSGV